MTEQRTTFLYDNSYDGTTDLLISKMEVGSVFRFNFDLWRDYRLQIGPAGFEISDPAGRVLRQQQIAKVYWRKPCRTRDLFPDKEHSREELYLEEELWYAIRELVNMLWTEGRVVLVEPRAEERVGKLVQMRLASLYFKVPAWKMVVGSPEQLNGDCNRVVKSLTLGRVCEGAVVYTTRVDERELDPGVPWLIQDYVNAETDVTVVYVRGDAFAFELARDRFVDRTADWRQAAFDPVVEPWKPHTLPESITAHIRSFMARLRLDYGRLDFLLSRGEYFFLEVNPNGEWGWLDAEGCYGLLDRILLEVSPATPTHPIPMTPGFLL